MTGMAVERDMRSFGELTKQHFGERLSMKAAWSLVEGIEIDLSNLPAEPEVGVWLGSIGYERHKSHLEFAQMLVDANVQQLIDVRELPISRRRGYAKTALGEALAAVGIDYVHIKALGNPKPLRDLYKSGQVEEGRQRYEKFLRTECQAALDELVPLLQAKRSVLMCVEDDPTVCHRSVIIDALRQRKDLALEVTHI